MSTNARLATVTRVKFISLTKLRGDNRVPDPSVVTLSALLEVSRCFMLTSTACPENSTINVAIETSKKRSESLVSIGCASSAEQFANGRIDESYAGGIPSPKAWS